MAHTVRSEYFTADEIGLLFPSRPWFLSAVDDVQIARRWISAAQLFDAPAFALLITVARVQYDCS
jgi:hypothetical protein